MTFFNPTHAQPAGPINSTNHVNPAASRAWHRLRRRDIVKLVDHHMAPDGTEGNSIEMFNAPGETIAVTRVPASTIEAWEHAPHPARSQPAVH